MKTDTSKINIKKAASGKISFGEAITLHETSKSKVVFIPYFIPRSSGSELAIKLISYKKLPSPNNWVKNEEKSLNLNSKASYSLMQALRNHLITAEKDEEGEFIVIKLSDGNVDFKNIDTSNIAKAIAGILAKDNVIEYLTSKELTTEMLNAFKIAIRYRDMQSAVSQLHNFLENGENSEQIYQEWCNEHSWAFGNSYLLKDNQRNISASDNLDLILPSAITGFRDIVELKRPDKEVLNWDESHKNFFFTSEVSKAIGQCHRYIDVFSEIASNGLRDNPEVIAYHPKAIIVIGRSNKWTANKYKALHGLNARLHGISIMTYDQLLRQGERLIEIINTKKENDTESELLEDDLPF